MSTEQDLFETPLDIGDDSMFESTLSPPTMDVSLNDAEGNEEDENPFGQPEVREKSSTNTTNTVESPVDNEKNLFQNDQPSIINLDEDDEDLFGVKTTNNNPPLVAIPPQVPVIVPEPQRPAPVTQEIPLFSVDTNVNSPQPVKSTTPFEKQLSSSTPFEKQLSSSTTFEKQLSSSASVLSKPVRKQSTDHNIEISVSDPTKVGDGMSSYMTYRLTTKTTLPIFKKSEFSVNRRFSDFLGLHMKLVTKHLHTGIIVPSPPEKDTISSAKVKISNDNIPADFIDRRRALLERYLNRLVRHNKLIEDSDVRDFLEMPNELPKSTNTQAISGAGFLRAISTISNQVTKLTTKKSEQDEWFEEKLLFVVDLHSHLKNLYSQFNTLYSQRKEAAHALKQFSTSLNHLATVEEHTLLSSALIELANLEEKLDQINTDQSLKEYSILTELIKEYVSLLDMVQLAFQERIKLHQTWLHAEDTLRKKRETKTKLEQTPKGADKLPQAEMEIQEWENKVVHGKEDFERISTTIKQEMDVFEQTRVDDFKQSIDNYLKNLLEEEEKILQIWESYLPEANKINV